MRSASSRFNPEERRLAYDGWRTFVYEIEGGLRSEFDRTPADFNFGGRPYADHRADPEGFWQRAHSLSVLSGALGHFTGKVVRDQAPDQAHRWVEIERVLQEGEVAPIDSFTLAVGRYAALLRGYAGGESSLPELEAAAVAACQVVRPEAWGVEGSDRDIYGGSAKFVLEAVMRGEQPLIKTAA